MVDVPEAPEGDPLNYPLDSAHSAGVVPFISEIENLGGYIPDPDPRWQYGFFVGFTRNFTQQSAVFIRGLQNDERRLLEDGQHSTLYSISRPAGGGARLFVGIPYWFKTSNEVVEYAPDKSPIFRITSDYRELEVLRADYTVSHEYPVIRCTLRGVNGKFITCLPTETHNLRFIDAPEFTIFKDRHLVTSGGDFLLRINGGPKNYRPSPCLDPRGGMSATLSLGNASKVVVADSPPPDFVSNVCLSRKVHLALGCVDQARVPTITQQDFLLAGGLDQDQG